MPDGLVCRDRFDEMLALEFTDAGYGKVHHLTVLAFYLQHSDELTDDGWSGMRDQLRAWFDESLTVSALRQRARYRNAPGPDKPKITGTPGKLRRFAWNSSIWDVDLSEAERYCASVEIWTRSVYDVARVAPPS